MIPWNYKNEKNIFIQREENGVPYLSFAALEETGLVVRVFHPFRRGKQGKICYYELCLE